MGGCAWGIFFFSVWDIVLEDNAKLWFPAFKNFFKIYFILYSFRNSISRDFSRKLLWRSPDLSFLSLHSFATPKARLCSPLTNKTFSSFSHHFILFFPSLLFTLLLPPSSNSPPSPFPSHSTTTESFKSNFYKNKLWNWFSFSIKVKSQLSRKICQLGELKNIK